MAFKSHSHNSPNANFSKPLSRMSSISSPSNLSQFSQNLSHILIQNPGSERGTTIGESPRSPKSPDFFWGGIKDPRSFSALPVNRNSWNESFFCDPEKPPQFQIGVLRTNCIDCLDRTNVAQYAFGKAALGRQLKVLGLSFEENLEGERGVTECLMDLYRDMGDVLAMQYGGSPAHNTVCSHHYFLLYLCTFQAFSMPLLVSYFLKSP